METEKVDGVGAVGSEIGKVSGTGEVSRAPIFDQVRDHPDLMWEILKHFLGTDDPHKEAASRMFDIPVRDVDLQKRTRSKGMIFRLIYGRPGDKEGTCSV